MKIVYLDFDDIQNPLLGAGQARATLAVASRLVKFGHKVLVISSRYPGSKDRREAGIQYKHIGLGTKWIQLNNLLYILCLPFYVRKINKQTTDIIIECFTAPISTLFSPLFTKVPVVVLPSMFRADEFSNKYHLPFHWAERVGARFYRYMMPYSNVDRAKMLKLNPLVRTKIISQGVDEKFFQIKSKIPKHILFFGRLDIYQKGIDLLLASYGKIKHEIKYPLLLAGHGPDYEKVESLIKKLKLQDRVKMVGFVDGQLKNDIFSKSLFAAFPSRHDEICLSSLELLASGIPLVGFDLPESVWAPNTVLLRAKRYSIQGYAAKLLEATEERRIKKMRAAAKRFARGFSWDKVAKETEGFLEMILAGKYD